MLLKKMYGKSKNYKRIRRKLKIRSCIKKRSNLMRLTVYKSSKHIYAQVFSSDGCKVYASATSCEKEIFFGNDKKSKIEISALVGALVAKRALKDGIKRVVFDRSGFCFHGRLKALADSARNVGLLF